MTFDLDTLSFQFLFLPAVLLCFTLAPQRCKNGVLVAASLIFYALGDLRFLPLMLCSLLLDYGVCAKLVRSTVQMKGRRLFFWGSIIKNILLMVVSMAGSQLGWFPMPLGLMVYTVTSMGYVIDVYNGDEYFDGDLIDFLLFTTFFGKLQAGPIVQYTELKEQWQHRELGLQRVKTGVKFYVGGLAKLVILAQGNAAVQQAIEQLPDASQTVLSTWVFIIVSTFSLYYTLTGYCDMARGLANLLGMDFPENFHYPFQSRTVSDFFNRFNITVTKFINRYVYIFLGADTNGVLSTIVNTLLTTMLMGVWFGLRLNYLVWGVYFAAFILLERYFLMRFLVRMPPIVDRIYTFVVVMFSFTIFSGGDAADDRTYIRSMFGLKRPAVLEQRHLLHPDHKLPGHPAQLFLCHQPDRAAGKDGAFPLAKAAGRAGAGGVPWHLCGGGFILRIERGAPRVQKKDFAGVDSGAAAGRGGGLGAAVWARQLSGLQPLLPAGRLSAGV